MPARIVARAVNYVPAYARARARACKSPRCTGYNAVSSRGRFRAVRPAKHARCGVTSR